MKHMLDLIAENTAPPGEPYNTIYECVDCLAIFDHWPSDNMPESECAGKPTPIAQAIHDATTGLPDDVKAAMAKALGIEP